MWIGAGTRLVKGNGMGKKDIWYKCTFRLRERCKTIIAGNLRHLYWSTQGMRIGRGTILPHCCPANALGEAGK